VKALARQDSIKPDVKVLAAPGERGVVGRVELEAHQPEERLQKPFGLTKWQVEEETERQRRFDGDVGVTSAALRACRPPRESRCLSPRVTPTE
jgi:hypothetical protein